MAEVRIENDNRNLLLNELEDRVKVALTAVGMQAETDVKKGNVPVDTGLLRNSITFAVSGEGVHQSKYRADSGDKSGSYKGKAPNDKVPAVYIGTNVEYAKYVQFGTSTMKARDFLMAPLRANLGHYKDIITKYLKQE